MRVERHTKKALGIHMIPCPFNRIIIDFFSWSLWPAWPQVLSCDQYEIQVSTCRAAFNPNQRMVSYPIFVTQLFQSACLARLFIALVLRDHSWLRHDYSSLPEGCIVSFMTMKPRLWQEAFRSVPTSYFCLLGLKLVVSSVTGSCHQVLEDNQE